MKKFDMLPVIAALFIALLVIPFSAVPVVSAITPAGSGLASVVTIPEDDLTRNTGLIVLDLEPTENTLTAATGWYTDSLCSAGASATVGPELTAEPIYYPTRLGPYYKKVSNALCEVHYFAPTWTSLDKGYSGGMDLLSQHKILATLNGVPTTPTYVLCEIVEKEKAKIPPPDTKDPAKRQFPDEILKTTLQDVTDNFVCKFRWIKPGVGALDVYFVGPRVDYFIADHMLIVTVGYTVGRNTVWASELQDICILGWSMGTNTLSIELFDNPGLSTFPAGTEYYVSWNDPLNEFVSCDEAALWQRAWITGGWPWAEN